jgi:transcription elongation factor Elf1
MTRRFSSRQLSFLRNNIPINRVIETMLSVATGNKNGKLSFNCPVCHSANTSINANHNLARCFECRQNFNPIEFVMHQRHTSFVDSVKWLKQNSRKPVHSKISTAKHPSSHPASIGEVLSGMLPSLKEKATVDPAIASFTKRVSDLEHRLQQLELLVKQLRLIVSQK